MIRPIKAFRYPRGNGYGLELPNINEILQIGKGRIITEEKKLQLLILVQGYMNVKKQLKF